MQNLFFLSGLPRSGSTLLGSILNQNPDIYVTPTSPLSDIICIINDGINALQSQYTFKKEDIEYNVYNSILMNYYKNITKPYVIDKHRAWPRNIMPLRMFYGEPKIIATNRRVSEVMSSYILLLDKDSDNFIDTELRKNSMMINNKSRLELLWNSYVSDPYNSLKIGFDFFRDNICLIEYNDIVFSPDETLNKIYNFLKIEPFDHDFTKIENTLKEEKDGTGWGLKGLHDIRSSLSKISPPPEAIIGEEFVEFFDRFNLSV